MRSEEYSRLFHGTFFVQNWPLMNVLRPSLYYTEKQTNSSYSQCPIKKDALGHCQIQKRARASLQDFHPWKGTFGFHHAKWLDQKFRKEISWIPHQKRSIEIFLVLFCSLLCQRNHMWTQKNIVFGMEWTWVAGSTWDFSQAKHDSHERWKFYAEFLSSIQKRSFQHFWWRHFRSTTCGPFFRD